MNVNNAIEEKKKTPNRKKEGLLLAIVFIIIIGIVLVVYGKIQSEGSVAIVTIDGDEYGRYPLSRDQEIPIKINGETTNYLVIKNGMADVTEANCPDLLCVNMKAISKDGETIVCLPNKVVVEVESETEQTDLDATVQ